MQFSGSFFIFHFIFIYFHIDIVYECIVLRCIVENKLTYLLTLSSAVTKQSENRTMHLSSAVTKQSENRTVHISSAVTK